MVRVEGDEEVEGGCEEEDEVEGYVGWEGF